MESISDIDTNTKEGKYLMMALAALTVSPSICINGVISDGTKLSPDGALQLLTPVVEKVFNS